MVVKCQPISSFSTWELFQAVRGDWLLTPSALSLYLSAPMGKDEPAAWRMAREADGDEGIMQCVDGLLNSGYWYTWNRYVFYPTTTMSPSFRPLRR